jgi:hypothetical protein
MGVGHREEEVGKRGRWEKLKKMNTRLPCIVRWVGVNMVYKSNG